MIGMILCIEDQEVARIGVLRELAKRGYPRSMVRFAKSAEAALRLMRSGTLPPNFLVLADVRLPGMSGLEFLAQISSDEDLAHVPVWMLSGVDDEELVARAMELGARDFYNKNEVGADFSRVIDELEAAWLELEGWT